MNRIELYTDGACSGNPGPGGFAWILKYNDYVKEYSEGYRLTTNNRMELLAVISGLSHIRKKDWPVTIYSDSRYVVDTVKQNWIDNWKSRNFKNVANVDLWIKFLEIYQPSIHTFEWVKGHADNPYNNRCDELAVKASMKSDLRIDTEYEEISGNLS
ncbi:MAG: ribonuclease HI [Bacteroidia bacterium]|nr:ribonuclease HI [Bacteroidia bacterium]